MSARFGHFSCQMGRSETAYITKMGKGTIVWAATGIRYLFSLIARFGDILPGFTPVCNDEILIAAIKLTTLLCCVTLVQKF